MNAKVTVVKCQKYELDAVYNAVKQALDNIGFKTPRGKKVLVKPNILGAYRPEDAVTTHPIVVEAVCKLLKEHGCKTYVGDSSGFSGSTRNAIQASGIKEAAERHGATALSFESTKISQKPLKGKVLDEIALPSIIEDVDMIINLPKLKTHSLMTFTAGVKNLFGFVPGGRKPDYHNKARNPARFAELLCDVYAAVKPKLKLTIVDGIIGMEGNGPSAGKPKETGIIIASDDAAALDYVVQDIIGLESPIIKCLQERKLLDASSIERIGEIPRIPYKGPSSIMSLSKLPGWLQRFIERQMTAHPYVNEDKCAKCRICERSCPARAITMEPYPAFDRKKCIDCYCCHELCPEHAIYLKGTIWRRLLMKAMHLKRKADRYRKR